MMGERWRELSTLILGDVACFVLALWVTLAVRYLDIPTWERLELHLLPFLLLSGVWVMFFFSAGLYDKQTSLIKQATRKRLWFAQITNMVVAAFLFLVIPFGIAPKLNLAIYLVISTALLTGWRYFAVRKTRAATTQQRALLLAYGPEAEALVAEVNGNDRYNYTFVRVIDEAAATSAPQFQQKLLRIIEREDITIVVASKETDYVASVLPALFELSFLQFQITFVDFVSLYEDTFDRVPPSVLGRDWFLTQVTQSRRVLYDALRRMIDVVCAAGLLLVVLPVFPLVAVAIKLEDGGPLWYMPERVGLLGRPITLYKFRTKNGRDSGEDALSSTLRDTRVGAFLRRTRLDELPQLWNIIRGDLSFIGPRPEMPELAAVYAAEIPYYNARHLIKPGLSGWAQISDADAPRGGVDSMRTQTKLSYDLYYLKHRSYMLDLHIAIKTVATLLLRTGT